MHTDERIKKALTVLSSISREDGYSSDDLDFIMDNVEQFIHLYKEDGIVRSLTHQVLFNSEVAHYFCISLKERKELWEQREMQEAFAEALRRGDSLLVDALSFLREYQDIDFIQDALVEQLNTIANVTFQASVLGSMGLSERPRIKKAILGRKHDIIAGMLKHWHECGPVSFVPCLIQDAEVKQTILGFKPEILKALREDESLADVTMLIENIEWIRTDRGIIKAVARRIKRKKPRVYSSLIRAVKQHNLHNQYPILKKAVEPYDWL